MSKVIIALSCSPSRGFNSDSMLDAFIKGAQRLKGIEIEKIYLQDVPMDYYSYDNRLGPAPHETAFAELANKIMRADGLIIATPTYNFSVPAHLKNFIDRIRFIALDMTKKNMMGQPTGMLGHLQVHFLVSGGTPWWAQKMLFFAFPPFWLRGVFLYYGAHCLGSIYTGDVKAFENEKFLARCTKRGKEFAKHLFGKPCTTRFWNNFFWRTPQRS